MIQGKRFCSIAKRAPAIILENIADGRLRLAVSFREAGIEHEKA